MKFNPSFQLRDVCGEHVMVAMGAEFVDFNRLLALNDTAFELYQAFADQTFEAHDLEAFLLSHYEGATPEAVAADVEKLLADFQKERLVIS